LCLQQLESNIAAAPPSAGTTGPLTRARPWAVHGRGQTAAVVSLASDPNKDYRPYMEDGQKVLDPLPCCGRSRDDTWGLFAVYDGHGGRGSVDYCESKLHDVLVAELRSQGPNSDASCALTACFRKVDAQLAMLGEWNCGCTATVALVHRQRSSGRIEVHVANVGDSRAVIVGDSGVRRVSTDHKANTAQEARRVEKEGGVVRNGRVGGQLSISRSLGDHSLKAVGVSCMPDICSVEAGDVHVLVIASDGLWDVVSEEDVQRLVDKSVQDAIVQGGGEQAISEILQNTAAQTLVSYAIKRGSRDNILALVVFL